jgi:hypothetical protein
MVTTNTVTTNTVRTKTAKTMTAAAAVMVGAAVAAEERRTPGRCPAVSGRSTRVSRPFDGHIEFRFTFHHTTGATAQAAAEQAAGVVPFAVAIPRSDITEQVTGTGATFFTNAHPRGTQWPPPDRPSAPPPMPEPGSRSAMLMHQEAEAETTEVKKGLSRG